jgi:glycosyltransferase involved in cell wall biosynthesis
VERLAVEHLTPPAPRRRKVGITNIAFYDDYAAKEGGYVHFFEAAKRWHDFDIVFFAPEPARKRVAEELPDAQFVAIPGCDGLIHSRPIVFVLRMFAAAFTQRRKLREMDAIYPFTHQMADVFPAIVAAPRRTAVQVHHLMDKPWERPGGLFHNSLAYVSESIGVGLVRHFAKSVVVLNNLVAQKLRMPRDAKVFVSGSATWTIPIDHASKPIGERSGAAYVGRFHPSKGLDDIIEAWALVRERAPNAKLTLIGTGDPAYNEHLREKVRANGLEDRVAFAGQVTDEEKAAILGSSRAFVSGTREEGFGIAPAEAMAIGTPCVMYDLPVFDDVFPGGRMKVPVGDIPAFADAIVRVLTDDELFASLSAEARAVGESFSWDKVAGVMEQTILQVSA